MAGRARNAIGIRRRNLFSMTLVRIATAAPVEEKVADGRDRLRHVIFFTRRRCKWLVDCTYGVCQVSGADTINVQSRFNGSWQQSSRDGEQHESGFDRNETDTRVQPT